MMKSIFNYIFLFLLAAIATGCTDDSLLPEGERTSGNTIRFSVSTGTEDNRPGARSGLSPDDEGLSPLVLSDGTDSLYLHRYVAARSERATGGKTIVSRSTPINSADKFKEAYLESGFYVSAAYADDNVAYFPLSKAVLLTTEDDEDIWQVANPLRFWPGKRKLRFHAFAPTDALALLQNPDFSGETISFSYEVPTYTDPDGVRRDAERQPDLMFATTECSHYSVSSHSDLVPLTFRHSLSAIKFAVRDVSKWTIVDISIQGVAGSGTCTFTDDDGFVWSDYGASNNYTQTFNYDHEDPYDPDSDDPDKDVPALADAPVINDKMPETTFMLIPQEIPEDSKLSITLKSKDGDTLTLTGDLRTSDIPRWEPGKEYVYTISTTSINWTYVFEVIGSVQGPKVFNSDTHKWVNGDFSDDNTKIEIGAAVSEGSYYQVQSYRYRTNNPSKIELLPWRAQATEGKNIIPAEFSGYADKIPASVESGEWLLKNWKFEDEGSDTLKLFKNLSFKFQYVATNYDGDWWLRSRGEKYGSETTPYDLSFVKDNTKRNTANCYVVNAGGWYSIPLYYGSSIKDDKDIIDTYTNIDYTVNNTWKALPKFIDYKGTPIEQGEILTPVKDAILVWQDAYGLIDTCRYDKDLNQIVFHIDPDYLQQGNCVVAIRDNEGSIIWSWHIWITDHWVNEENLKLGRGDVECEAENPDKGPFDFAPYNLGWCDPKDVMYLRRVGKITFTQTESDKTTEVISKTLDVIQRSDLVEYWIGNSVYYQFGRKDPMVGFINEINEEKYNFGEEPYEIISGGNLEDCITNPNAFFASNSGLTSSYYNLWNNYNSENITAPGNMTLTIPNSMIAPETLNKFKNNPHLLIELSLEFSDYTTSGTATVKSGNPNLTPDFAYSANKTIYDPSPVGYVVPPCDFFLIFGVGNPNSGGLVALEDPSFFKGDSIPIVGHPGYFNYTTSPKRDHSGEKTVIFNVNGQKRRPDYYMNPSLVYLWSNTVGFYSDWSGQTALGYALGYDDPKRDFAINSYFQGSKLIARPVRCIKEF